MELSCLYCNQPDLFGPIPFRPGLNVVLGEIRKPDDAEAHYGLGAALAVKRKREDAAAELREALRLRPNMVQARNLLDQLQR